MSVVPASRTRDRVEWPTLLLIAAVFILWALVTIHADNLGPVLPVLILTFVLVQHSSLHHEIIHGHPFRNRTLNELIAFLPIGLLIPFGRFRDMHLAHHNDPTLTDPHDDPESNFLDPAVWKAFSRPARTLLTANNTLFGRMALGPVFGTIAMYGRDLRAILGGDGRTARAYLLHSIGVILMLLWLGNAASIGFWSYFAACWLALSVLRIRTFLEHRAHQKPQARSVVIEDRGPLALLFLNNNFHAVHHAHPNLAWYKIPGEYARRKEVFLRRNGGYRYASYLEILRKYMFRTKDPVAHPLMGQRPRNSAEQIRETGTA